MGESYHILASKSIETLDKIPLISEHFKQKLPGAAKPPANLAEGSVSLANLRERKTAAPTGSERKALFASFFSREKATHTSWMMAISAASPRRGPIFSTRV